MTVFIAHAPEDAEAAAALEVFLERRGVFVTREDGSRGFQPLGRSDVAVMLWSTRALFMAGRFLMERRALDAWAEGRLVSVKLDHGIMPVGLRDLRVIEATFEPQREIAFAAVNKAIQDAIAESRRLENELAREGTGNASDVSSLDEVAPAPAPKRELKTKEPGNLWAWVLIGVVVLGTALGVASLLAGVSWRLWVAVAGVVGVCALAAVVAVSAANARQDAARGKRRPPGSASAAEPGAPAEAAPGERVFVSYARADVATVSPVVDALKDAGQAVWMDTQEIGPGEGWAGEIVRAIRASGRVCVMCSTAAFQSDHVKREIYLADRYRRPLTPVLLDDAVPPEDFEYFFAGLQLVRLSELPVEGRGVVLAQALSAR